MKNRADHTGQLPYRHCTSDQKRKDKYQSFLSGLFMELLEINVSEQKVSTVFYSTDEPGLAQALQIEEGRLICRRIHPQEYSEFHQVVSWEHIKELVKKGSSDHFTFRLCCVEGGDRWLRLVLTPIPEEPELVLCCVASVEEEERRQDLYRQIADRFILDSCDFMACLDLTADSCTMICKNSSAFGKAGRMGYISNMEAYIKTHVIPEERSFVQNRTAPKEVLEGLECEGEYACSYGVIDKNGGYGRKRLKYVYCDEPDGNILMLCTDITGAYIEERRQKEELERIREHARTDSLTGLYNREAVSQHIKNLIKQPECGQSILLFIDLDDFKQVNDTLGHRSGDRFLCHAARALREILRSSDVIGRVGGDEFIAFLPGISSMEEAALCADRLCETVVAVPGLETGGMKLSCSIGGAVYPYDGADYDTLVQKADIAVYEAKRKGKNRFVFYESSEGQRGQL